MLGSLFAVLLALSSVSAHNWVNSPSRVGTGAQASTTKPTVPSKTGEPHVQVRAGQKFPIEWVIGHPSSDYKKFFHFVIINKKDADKMALHNPVLLNEYFKECGDAPPSAEFQAYHYKYDDTTLDDDPNKKDGVLPPRKPNFFASRVPTNSAEFIPRDRNFIGRFKGAPSGGRKLEQFDYSKVSQFRYKADSQKANRRCAAKSAKHPWIVAAHRYRGVTHQPSRPDVALFEIPAGQPAGDYIVHYIWRGYYDSIDVQVLERDSDVPAPYGGEIDPDAPPPPVKFQRIDHCSYPTPTLAGRCVKMSGAPLALPQACLDECEAKPIGECRGVAVVPLRHPSSVWSGFRQGARRVPVNIPFGGAQCTEPAADDGATHMCYPLVPREPTDVAGEFELTTDTEDPAFYATCFHRVPPSAFGGAGGVVPPDSTHWEYRGQCISCAAREANARGDVTPLWELAPTCVNCDLRVGSSASNGELVLALNGNVRNAKSAGPQALSKQGGVTFVDAPGALGKAAKFDGKTSSFIDVGEFNVPGSKFTIAAFANFAHFNNDPRVISKSAGTSRDQHTFMISSAGGSGATAGKKVPRVRLRVSDDETAELRGNKVLTANKWHHIAATYDGKVLRMYLDGVAAGSKTVAGAVRSTDQATNIGRSPVGGRPFKGMIADVRVLATVLNANAIKNLAAKSS